MPEEAIKMGRISIHSARVGGDVDYDAVEGTEYISIHSARVGGDDRLDIQPILSRSFQSTPPVWAETASSSKMDVDRGHFNPLRPCGRRPGFQQRGCQLCPISIHSARVGGDLMLFKSFLYFIISIHSARVGGDIARVEAIPGGRLISIHSARVGGDRR